MAFLCAQALCWCVLDKENPDSLILTGHYLKETEEERSEVYRGFKSVENHTPSNLYVASLEMT